MKKVLIIAYYFPPLGGSGVQRILKFVKYLPKFGWQPTVITVGPTAYYAKDESLLKEIESLNITIIRTNSLDANAVLKNKYDVVKMPKERTRKILNFISDVLFIPDNKIGWRRKAMRAVGELVKKEKFDVVFSTSPPTTDFLIGRDIKKKYKIPLVLDYRDSWMNYPFKYFPTPLHRYIHYRMERSVLRAADMTVTTSRRTKEELLRRYRFLTHNDVTILSHGFDPDDLTIPSVDILPRIGKMRITFSGMFYGTITPVYFLRALALVLKKNSDLRGRIEACFVGLFKPEYINLINDLGLQNSVNLLGYLEHKESIKYLLASDVVWVIMQDDLTTPGKIFEYIGTRKKILGCVPAGYIRALIEEAGGLCVDPTNVQEIADAIVQLYHLYEHKQLYGAKPEIVEKYDRVTLTGELAKIFTKFLEV
ncbi:MAG: glycosyltransferase family 4 protein [Bacteroidota bacterium]|nr:glycosyltransferase family 4 protein [Bacteroidota bacterium]